MVCIYCGNETQVTNSRSKKRYSIIWRRRICKTCGSIATTLEQYDLATALLVTKRSGALESFQRDKLLISIARAIDHRQNAPQAASHLTQTVIEQLLKTKPIAKTVLSKNISQTTSIVLKHYDAASSIKYMSYYAPMQSRQDLRHLLH